MCVAINNLQEMETFIITLIKFTHVKINTRKTQEKTKLINTCIYNISKNQTFDTLMNLINSLHDKGFLRISMLSVVKLPK